MYLSISIYIYIYIIYNKNIHSYTYSFPFAYTCTFTHAHTPTPTRTHTYACAYTFSDTCTYKHTRTHTHIFGTRSRQRQARYRVDNRNCRPPGTTYAHTRRHTYTHTHIHTYAQTHIHTRTHTHTYAHTHIHTYIRTYVHTYIYIYIYIYIFVCLFIYIYLCMYVAEYALEVQQADPDLSSNKNHKARQNHWRILRGMRQLQSLRCFMVTPLKHHCLHLLQYKVKLHQRLWRRLSCCPHCDRRRLLSRRYASPPSRNFQCAASSSPSAALESLRESLGIEDQIRSLPLSALVIAVDRWHGAEVAAQALRLSHRSWPCRGLHSSCPRL